MKSRSSLPEYLKELQLVWCLQHHEELAQQAAQQGWAHPDYLEHLLEGECHRRRENRTRRRLQAARFPVQKTLDAFDWSWPKKIDRTHVMDLMRLAFLEDKTNVILLGGVGLGKSHVATAIGRQACLQGHSVLWTTAIEMVNVLVAAQAAQRLRQELKKYFAPDLLILDELGYLPIDKQGADLLFQVVSARYERGSILLTTNRPFKQWAAIFNNDNTLASAVLDRLLHHAQTLVIEGQSYRMKDQVNP
ncbi:MAG: IS21-like element helper ATPase IstB [Bryobacteraceae bacterium]